MEDSELEEGEACDYLDPDAFSYIDEKIQNVLGHFQQEFVGGEISAENLGAKWGGYGSFLPAYKRSPSLLTQPKSPLRAPNPRDSKSNFESKNQNRNVLPNSSISKNTLPSRPPPADNNNNNNKNNVTKKETRLPASGPSSRRTPIQKTNNNNINNNNATTTTTTNNSNSNNNSSKPSIDQKTLKVRIKVGSDNNLRRNNNNNNNNNDNNNNKNKNAALYNNLGLDISPSTSYDASTGGSAGPSPVSKVVPGESPQSILQTMTSIWTPGGFVLSPLRACFVNFTGKVTPSIKNTPTSQNDADLDFMVRECKGSKSRSGKHDKKKHISVGTKSLKDESPILPLEQPHLDKESRFKGEKSTNESVKEERFESFQNLENLDLKGKGKLKSIKVEKQENLRDSSERKSRSESKKKLSVSKTDSEESNKIGGTGIGTATGSTMKNLKVEENLVEPKIQAPHFEDKRVKKEKQIINTPSIDSKERKKEKDYISRSKKMENVPNLDKEKEIYNQLFEDFGEDNNITKDLSETKKKPVGIKIDKEREIIPKERPSYNKLEKDPINEANVSNSTLVPVNNNSTNLPVPVLPLVPTVPTEIKEDWVGCDKCCKWRLLPYWTKPESLPKKWHCKLLDWLPGKNRCDVSEEETTAGANALNLVPIPIPNAATSVPIPVVGQTGHPDPIPNNQILKKKDKVPDLVVKKKDKGKVGLKEPASYSSGGLGLESKSAEFITDAKKLNHQSSGRYSDGGDMVEKQSKSRNKRPMDPDDSKAYKKPKKEENLHTQIKEKPIMSKPIFNEKVEPRGVKFEKKENFSNVPELERYEKSEDRMKKPGGTKGPNSNKLEELGSSGKRDGNFRHPSVEATSSSSKVSGSRRSRSRSKLHEKRASSPIDSVSSSPVRHSNSERLHRKMKGVKDEDLTINIASYTLPFVSPKRNTGGGSNEIERPNKLPRFSETHRAEGGSSKNVLPEQDNRFSSGSAGLDKSGIKDGRRLGKNEIRISSRPPKEKERIHSNPEKGGSEKRQQVVEKRELEMPVKRENRMQGNGDASRSMPVPPQPRKVEIGGVQASVARQATPNGLETSSPAKRESHSAVYALLKEARALKHTADRLKNDESELEGTGLYFEAALKFLQAASLCEPVGNDTSRLGDSTQAMQIYSDTAKLCEFCAHAYERCKKMGAASLAYKCVEVAYLKAAFYKHPSASRDRHELQSTLQILQTGESPSSSASDIDNLNKVNKDSNSPQVAAGNHLLVSRNHAHMMRLLAYTNDLNCAFEATRKSQTAFAAASSNPENGENGENGLASVRRALDFGFHNVRELLQLIRVSMDSVS